MNQELVNRLIWLNGGERWLRCILPRQLFNFLEGEIWGIETVKSKLLSDNQGWAFFLKKTALNEKQIMAVFYKTGEWPICYLGKIKLGQGLGPILVDETSLVSNCLMINDFRKLVVEMMVRKEIKL